MLGAPGLPDQQQMAQRGSKRVTFEENATPAEDGERLRVGGKRGRARMSILVRVR